MSAHDPIAVLRFSELRIAAPLRHLVVAILLLLLVAAPARAQLPDTLLHTILPDRKTLQIGAQLGYTVAISGEYAVLGTPYDISDSRNGVVKVFDSATGALRLVLHSPETQAGGNFGCALAISGSRLVVGARLGHVGIDTVGTAYVYDLAGAVPSVPILSLQNPDPTADDGGFGAAVAISGSRIVISAIYNRVGGAFEAGRVYVYDLDSAHPTNPLAVLEKPNPQSEDHFGETVAIDGSYVLVGRASGDDTVGTVDVYDFAGATPTVPVLTLQSSLNFSRYDGFGASLSISGTKILTSGFSVDIQGHIVTAAFLYDLTSATPDLPLVTFPGPNDKVVSAAISGTTVVVGYRDDDIVAPQSGSAFVYDLSSTTPTSPVMILPNPGPAIGDHFGWAVATDGTRILVSAPGDDTGSIDAGSAYVYDPQVANPTSPVAMLNNPGPDTGNTLGLAVAISGNLMVAGAPRYDVGGQDAGAVFVYDLSGATPTVPLYELDNPNPDDARLFGSAVAISGRRVVVGELRGAFHPKVYVYDLDSGTPTVPVAVLAKPLPPDDPSGSQEFGFSVGISGTYVVVGNPFNDFNNLASVGAVFVFDLNSATPTVPIHILHGSAGSTIGFGWSVAISGSRVVVGFPFADVHDTSAGAAYVFDLAGETPTSPITILPKPDPVFGDYFGWSVAISGERVIVGAIGDNTGASGAGSAYVFDFSRGLPRKPIFTLHNPTPANNFGYSVAISGSLAVVASPFDAVNRIPSGTAYVYDLNGIKPEAPAVTLYNPNPASADNFSWAVAIDGTTAAIGTPLDDTVRPDHGAVYVFGPNPNAGSTTPTAADGLLASWKLTHFGTTAGHGPLEDDDRDGLNNLLEEAFNTDPLKPDAKALPAVVNEGGYLTLTIAKHPGVTYEVQSAATPDESAFSAATTTILLDNATTLKVRDNFPIGAPPSRFLRIKVTATP
jgi:hypothetical protein